MVIAKNVFDSERSGESLIVRQQAFCSRQGAKVRPLARRFNPFRDRIEGVAT